MNKLTEKQIEKIELDFDCHNVQVENNYITGIYDAPSNPENIGERMDIIDYYEWVNDQEVKDSLSVEKYGNDGRQWYKIDGVEKNTGYEFQGNEYAECNDGVIDCDGCPLTTGDIEEIAVKNAIKYLGKDNKVFPLK